MHFMKKGVFSEVSDSIVGDADLIFVTGSRGLFGSRLDLIGWTNGHGMILICYAHF